MNIAQKIGAAAVAGAAALTVTPAVPAQAAVSACVDVRGWGDLCISVDRQGYRITFYKYANPRDPADRVDFNLECANGRWFGDEGAFTIWSGQTRSYVFKVGAQGRCMGILIEKDGQLRNARAGEVG
jgi:hypothetical protein